MRRAALTAQPLIGFAVEATSHAVQAPPSLALALNDAVLAGVEPRGKHLLLHFADGRSLHSHLRMSGAWHAYSDSAKPVRSLRRCWLSLRANGVTLMQFDGPVLQLLRPGEVALHPTLSRLGPDVMADDFVAEAAVARARRLQLPSAEVGDVLLNQRVACGLGNIARCEALAASRVHPLTELGSVTDMTLAEVYRTAARILAAGVTGELPTRVYGHRQCRRCGSATTRLVRGEEGRRAHFCPTCQILHKVECAPR